ncbi:hypothetical protein [Actinomadura sp. HBU206391]|uniref:hypothetical protein n=1 Tax=Actinomadura sp. HBU206391 TaxID=2731692 RepID=UPI0016505338|nr:hypothetical protein [Actinomadura sp. HBU206391]MBC6461423.1 hypothetical protein [Actinomadura sp. HBU206391]
MGNLYDYFTAADDDAAASAADLVGGPADGGFDVLATKGIDPVVQMGTLEALLTGRPYKEVIRDPRQGDELRRSAEAAEHGVATLTDSLAAALADADQRRLAEVAVPWSETDEFWGQADPEILAGFLGELADLARRARDAGHRLYCWWSL